MTRREPPTTPPEPRCFECGRRFTETETVVRSEHDETFHVDCWSPA